jgi:hypothetical protein
MKTGNVAYGNDPCVVNAATVSILQEQKYKGMLHA